jgi:hypothetical protein
MTKKSRKKSGSARNAADHTGGMLEKRTKLGFPKLQYTNATQRLFWKLFMCPGGQFQQRGVS